MTSRQQYAIAYPFLDRSSMRAGHERRVERRFKTTVLIDPKERKWAADVAFLSVVWEPMPLGGWPAAQREKAERVAADLLKGVGEGPLQIVEREWSIFCIKAARPAEVVAALGPSSMTQ